MWNFAFEAERVVKDTKTSKHFKGYNEALNVARIILREEADNTGALGAPIPPFWINMSALFEHTSTVCWMKHTPVIFSFRFPVSIRQSVTTSIRALIL